MVQTRSFAKKLQSGQQVDDDSPVLQRNSAIEQNVPREDTLLPPPKKRRGAGTLKKSRRGKPDDGFPLNYDVLYLILSLCHPRDALHFARTCKSIRDLLMSKSSAFIWKAARCQVEGLPDCPADLSEPAYANLAFHPYCHVCGKYTSAIFWCMRRRYCTECRIGRLRPLGFFSPTIRNIIYPVGECLANKETILWFDKDEIDSWTKEYKDSPNKEEFLDKKSRHYKTIFYHARECELWQREIALNRRDELKTRRQERNQSILDRLKRLGYEREIAYFGADRFQESRKKPFKPLTDKEWDRILPKWLETMNRSRQLRLGEVVYKPCRQTLVSRYNHYVMHRSPDTPYFDLLPHVADLVCFPPFQSVIQTPEDTELGEDSFAPAFAQLPTLVNEWREQLNTECAELVKIPSHLIPGDASGDMGAVSSCANHAETFQVASDKLRLACAVFIQPNHSGVFTFPEVLFVSMCRDEKDSKRSGSIQDRFGIVFLNEAPYIVHACGLDPMSATPDDMDRRDARLRCLRCKGKNPWIMDWRQAMTHSCFHVLSSQSMSLSTSPRWQLIGDEDVETVRAAESGKKGFYRRCLLCLPRVGDRIFTRDMANHLSTCHDMEVKDGELEVHFAAIGLRGSNEVEMIEQGGKVNFRPF